MNKLKRIVKTNNIVKLSLILIPIIIILLSTTLAYYSWGSGANTNIAFDVIADSVYIYYDAGANISSSSLYPTDDKNDGIVKTITVKVDKESSSAKFNLYLDLKTIPIELQDSSFKYAIYEGTTLKKSGNFTETGSACTTNTTNHIVLLNNITPSVTQTTYTLYIWIDGTSGDNPSDMMNKNFEFILHADGVNLKEANQRPGTLYYELMSNSYLDNTSSTYVTSTTGIDFTAISSDTNGKGIYLRSGTENDPYPIYYYRGAVTNNNVLFANFCWQIVRTTETGGIKLIYNGTPSNGTCNNTGDNSQIGTSAFNAYYNSPAYVGYMYGTPYNYSIQTMSSITDTYYYGNDVTYTNGTYTLTDTITSSSWSSIYNTSAGIYNHHYTCLSTGNTCSSVYYIYYTTNSTAYYITLNNGKKVEDALSDMLDNNTTNSTIKGNSSTSGSIDYWYSQNMTSYTDKLEDTIWCNDRSIYLLNGWNPDGGVTSGNWTAYSLLFGSYGRTQVTANPVTTCNFRNSNVDKFTVSTSNGNGKLDYPVGLLTADEVMLAGANKNYGSNSTYYLNTGRNYWLASPSVFDNHGAYGFFVNSGGTLYFDYVDDSLGARPSVSLAPGTTFSGGDGTVNNPYTVT